MVLTVSLQSCVQGGGWPQWRSPCLPGAAPRCQQTALGDGCGWYAEVGHWNTVSCRDSGTPAITIKDKMIMNEGWSLLRASFMLEHEGKGFRKSYFKNEGGLSSWWSFPMVVSHQGGLLWWSSSGWSLIVVVFSQGGLLWWSFIRVLFHQSGLSWWFSIRVFSPHGGL